MLLLTLRGTPTIYQGEEIGMQDVWIPENKVQDPFELNVPGFGLGRDPVRTPMPWTSESNGGFTDAHPWLPLNCDRHLVNVAVQAIDKKPIFSLYKALLYLRRNNDALSVGAFRLVAAEEGVLAYTREVDESRVLIVLNMTDRNQVLRGRPLKHKTLLSTHLDDRSKISNGEVHLRPNEGLVLSMLSEKQ